MKEFYIDCDGIRLHSKLERPEGAEGRGPLCILIHGFTGHMEEDHIRACAAAMLSVGISVLRVEMYGHGGSDGEFRDHTLYKWVTNALAVVSYVKKEDLATDLYLCGHSQGGLLTMLIGGMCADDFKAIIPMSAAWVIPQAAREGSLLGQDFDPQHIPEVLAGDWCELSGDYIRVAQTIHVEDEIGRYKGKVLLIHGDADDTIPFLYSQKALELYADAELVPVSGADHCFRGHLQELSGALKGFFKAEREL